jgi:hypothetical protein
VKTPGLVVGLGGVLELMLDVEQPHTIDAARTMIGRCNSRKGPTPTSQLIAATRTAMAAFVPIVLSQGASRHASSLSATDAAR